MVTLEHQIGSRAQTPFKMIIELPCRDDCWIADDPLQWTQALHGSETISTALQRALAKSYCEKTTHDSREDFATLVLVHALGALAWDLTQRDLIGKSHGSTHIHSLISAPPELGEMDSAGINSSLSISPIQTGFVLMGSDTSGNTATDRGAVVRVR